MTLTEKSASEKADSLFYLFSFLGIGFLLFFSITTSPLTSNSWGSDSAFFQYAGYSIAKGEVMYRDIFDIKGPYLFLLQQIAYMAGGENGRYVLFLIQCICMAASLYFLDASCRLFHHDKKIWRLVSVFLYFFMLSYTLDGGNLTEEYGLPLLLLCQYLMLKTIMQQKKNTDGVFICPIKYTFCYGACFGILALTRLTNTCLICCIVLFFIIILLAGRQWKQLICHAVIFFTGTLVTVLPMILWYAFQGALEDMLYATYIFSFSYATEKAAYLRLGMYFPMLFFCLAGIVLNTGSKKDKNVSHTSDKIYAWYLLICLAAHTLILLFGKAYVHYYQLIIPPTLCAFWCVAVKWKAKKIRLLIAVIIVFNIMPVTAHVGRIVAAVGLNTEELHSSPLGKLSEKLLAFDTSMAGYGYQSKQCARDILEQIPVNERDSVYSDSPTWLFLSQRLSSCKYLETPGSFMQISKQIYSEMQDYFIEGKWHYVVLEKKDDTFIGEVVKRYYQAVGGNDRFVLYKFVSN